MSESPEGYGPRQRLGLWLGPLAFVLILAFGPHQLPPPALKMAAIGALVIVFWITEALPLAVTSLLGTSLAALLGVARAREVFAPFADPVIMLFLGSFLLAEALQVHGLDRRLALAILSLPGALKTPARVQVAFGAVTAMISGWISNTATTAMMLPLALGTARAVSDPARRPSPAGLVLLVGLAASLGGMATPVGTPPNLIGLGFIEKFSGRRLGFGEFMLLGVPLSLVTLALTSLVVRWMLPQPRSSEAASAPPVLDLRAQRAELGAWTRGQSACLAAFLLAVALWLAPGLLTLAGVPAGRFVFFDRLEESVVALLAATLLFVWPVGAGRRALEWRDAARIDWGTLLLFGGGLSLGKLFFDTGLAAVMGQALVTATGVSSLWGLTALALFATLVVTELCSNTASVSMVAPLVAALAQGIGVAPLVPLLAVTFGSSLGFMLPVSTPPNALVYGTGLVPLATMARVGIVVDVIGALAVFAVLRVLCPWLGLA